MYLECPKCGHKWDYKGIGRGAKCSQCGKWIAIKRSNKRSNVATNVAIQDDIMHGNNHTDAKRPCGMVIENLTQGSHPFKSEMTHLLVVRVYLQNCPLSGQYSGKGGRGCKDAGSIRDISHWLDKETGTFLLLFLFVLNLKNDRGMIAEG